MGERWELRTSSLPDVYEPNELFEGAHRTKEKGARGGGRVKLTSIAECVLSSARSRMKHSRAMDPVGVVTRRWLLEVCDGG